jgi:hypothetical protein
LETSIMHTPDVPTGWPTEPDYVPAYRSSDSPAAWQRDAREAERYAQPQQVVVHHHYAAPARRGPDVGQVLGWVGVGGIVIAALLAVAMTAIALGLAALALAILAIIVRGLWRDIISDKK